MTSLLTILVMMGMVWAIGLFIYSAYEVDRGVSIIMGWILIILFIYGAINSRKAVIKYKQENVCNEKSCGTWW